MKIKQRNKIIAILLIAITLFMTFNVSFAANLSSANLYSKGDCGNLLKYKGITVLTTMVVYSNGGVEYPAYCMDKALPGVGESGSYTVNINGVSIVPTVTVEATTADSRTYAIKDSKLIQVTEDDSTLWKKYYENDEDFHKDDLRFLVGNNCIEDCLGSLGTGNAKTYVIDNDNYEGLLLVSDGVTDIVSDEKMTLLYKETPKEDFIDQILFESCYGASESFYGEEDYFFQRTRPGKDNASAALYLKR